MSSDAPPPELIDCPVCSDPIDSCFGVFDCGHFACYKCALKIRRTVRRETSNQSSNRRGGAAAASSSTSDGLPQKNPPSCFVCRKQVASLTITEMPPKNPESYIYEKSEMEILTKLDNVNTKKFLPLNCYVTSTKCATKLQALIDFVCPFDECWDVDKKTGAKSQIPFTSFDLLQKHLRQDHNGCKYCDTCATQSVSFLSELNIYTPQEMRAHMGGTCHGKDSQAFTGHPSCQFCHNKTLLDGESMLEHLKHVHYVCDFCNMSSYKFTYYNDRDALNLHWAAEHKLCTHPECAQLDPVARVFAGELDLAKHMQERHNVKSKSLSMEAFGFTYAGGEITLPGGSRGSNNNSNASTSAANVQQMATQAAVGNTMITYDFVGSTRVVPLVPRTQQQQQQQQSNSSSNNNSNTNNGRRQPRPSKKNSNDDDDNSNNNNSSKQQQDSEEQKKKLAEADENVRTVISGLNNKQRDLFQEAAKKFMRQEIKAVEFFNIVHTRVITEEEMLEFLLDNFTETLRKHSNPALRDALISAKAIVLSAEAKKNKEAMREEQEKLAKDQKQQKIRQLHQMSITPGGGFSAGSSRGKPVTQVGGGNAWHQRAPAANQETSNIYKKAVNTGPSALHQNNNPWAKRMNEQSAMAGAASSGSGNNHNSGSDEFTLASLSAEQHNGNGNGKKKSKPCSPTTALNVSNRNNNNNNDDSPSLTEAFPTLPTTNRKGKPHANQPTNIKGAWKNNRLV